MFFFVFLFFFGFCVCTEHKDSVNSEVFSEKLRQVSVPSSWFHGFWRQEGIGVYA
jgi:hypothetical protein